MKTTGYQAGVLTRLESGAVVEIRAPVPPSRTARFWIGDEPVHPRTVERLFARGWITPTRMPGDGKLTGRAVITNLGRAALRRLR